MLFLSIIYLSFVEWHILIKHYSVLESKDKHITQNTTEGQLKGKKLSGRHEKRYKIYAQGKKRLYTIASSFNFPVFLINYFSYIFSISIFFNFFCTFSTFFVPFQFSDLEIFRT